MRFLLDTQILLILSQGDPTSLSSRMQRVVNDEENGLFISTVSFTEIAIKASIQKLVATERDIEKAVEDLRLIVLPFESWHALRMFDLPLHHRDPFDRMLIATALAESITMLSQDRTFKKYRGLRLLS